MCLKTVKAKGQKPLVVFVLFNNLFMDRYSNEKHRNIKKKLSI